LFEITTILFETNTILFKRLLIRITDVFGDLIVCIVQPFW